LTPDDLLNLTNTARLLEWQYELDTYNDKELRKIQRAVNKARNQVVSYVQERGDKIKEWSERRSEQIIDEMDRLTTGLQTQLGESISKMATATAVASIPAYNDILSFGGKVVGFNNVALSAAQLKSIVEKTPVGGRLLRNSLKDGTQGWMQRTFTAKMQGELREDLLAGRLRGFGPRELAKAIREKFDNLSKKEIITLARSYNHAASTKAMDLVYQQNQDVVKRVKWTATLETGYKKKGRGTCIRCAVLDGRTFELNDHPPCPLHPRCRCVLTPVTKSYKELGLDVEEVKEGSRPYTKRTRYENIDVGRRKKILSIGQHEGNYGSWFYKQGPKFQKDMVGPNRAKLIRTGEIDFDDLIRIDPRTNEVVVLRLDELTGDKDWRKRIDLTSGLRAEAIAAEKRQGRLSAKARAKLTKKQEADYKTNMIMNKEKWTIVDLTEAEIADKIGADWIKGTRPFDLFLDNEFIEVKTVIRHNPKLGLNHKLQVEPDARIRKEKFAKKYGVRPHIVSIVKDPDSPLYGKIFYRSEIGAWRLKNMEEIADYDALKARILKGRRKKAPKEAIKKMPSVETLKQAEDWGRKNLADVVDYDELSPEVAHMFNEYAAGAIKKMNVKIKQIVFDEDLFDDLTLGLSKENGTLIFNPKSIRTKEKLEDLMESQFKANQFTTSSPGHVWRHEIAHQRYFQLGGTEEMANAAIPKKVFEQMKEDISKWKGWYKKYISNYATMSEGEFYAEILAWEMDGRFIHPVIKKYMVSIERKLKKNLIKRVAAENTK